MAVPLGYARRFNSLTEPYSPESNRSINIIMIFHAIIFWLNLFQSVQAMQRGPIFRALESAVDCYQVLQKFDDYAKNHADSEGTISFDDATIQLASNNCWGQLDNLIYPKVAHVNLTQILLDVTAFLYQQGDITNGLYQKTWNADNQIIQFTWQKDADASVALMNKDDPPSKSKNPTAGCFRSNKTLTPREDALLKIDDDRKPFKPKENVLITDSNGRCSFLAYNYEENLLGVDILKMADVAKTDIYNPCIAHDWWGGRTIGQDYIGDVNDSHFMMWFLPPALADAFQRTINLWPRQAT
ncbi:hypothetical protein QBC41DRAFT_339809 [Cercophora samala]|uniref:Uncharacterized protein n=1 Tax=Cercophora samala TaxID=330535 RepID=A0AA39Z790_9PEZI|nr:hypothetical protein QBC41DRAFT_339809 [Cercophora samala]